MAIIGDDLVMIVKLVAVVSAASAAVFVID